ncbi:uncharacterized protein LOC143285756 [Babylonia areolata]|uniref:uncharacterized protein LOC143285756 n=1 Tax=Babylonia areolata TaxID=304850 RepID=UPI003FD0742A
MPVNATEDSYYYNSSAGLMNNTTKNGDAASDVDEDVASYIWIIGGSILLLVGTVGNLLALAVLSREKMRRQKATIYLLVAAATDLAVLYTGLLRQVILSAFHVDVRHLSEFGCRLHFTLAYFFPDFSAWVLALLSLARFGSVRWTFAFRARCNRSGTVVVIVIVGVVLFGLNSPFLVIVGDLTYGNVTYRCLPKTEEYIQFISKVWPWIDLSVFALIPLIIHIVCNIFVVQGIRHSIRESHRDRGRTSSSHSRRNRNSNGRDKITARGNRTTTSSGRTAWLGQHHIATSPASQCCADLSTASAENGEPATGLNRVLNACSSSQRCGEVVPSSSAENGERTKGVIGGETSCCSSSGISGDPSGLAGNEMSCGGGGCLRDGHPITPVSSSHSGRSSECPSGVVTSTMNEPHINEENPCSTKRVTSPKEAVTAETVDGRSDEARKHVHMWKSDATTEEDSTMCDSSATRASGSSIAKRERLNQQNGDGFCTAVSDADASINASNVRVCSNAGNSGICTNASNSNFCASASNAGVCSKASNAGVCTNASQSDGAGFTGCADLTLQNKQTTHSEDYEQTSGAEEEDHEQTEDEHEQAEERTDTDAAQQQQIQQRNTKKNNNNKLRPKSVTFGETITESPSSTFPEESPPHSYSQSTSNDRGPHPSHDHGRGNIGNSAAAAEDDEDGSSSQAPQQPRQRRGAIRRRSRDELEQGWRYDQRQGRMVEVMRRLLVGVSVLFCITTFPYSVYAIVHWFGFPNNKRLSEVTYASLSILMYCNNTANFILYCLASSRFRTEMRALWRALKNCRHNCCCSGPDLHHHHHHHHQHGCCNPGTQRRNHHNHHQHHHDRSSSKRHLATSFLTSFKQRPWSTRSSYSLTSSYLSSSSSSSSVTTVSTSTSSSSSAVQLFSVR